MNIRKLIYEDLLIFNTKDEECGWDFCGTDEASTYDGLSLMNKYFYEAVYTRESLECLIVFARKNYFYLNT